MDTTSKLILAVDIGTSSTRVAAFRADGTISGLEQYRYETVITGPQQEEQDPDMVFSRIGEAITACLSRPDILVENVEGIVFSSQMYSTFPVSADDRPLMNNIIWSDARAEKVAAALRKDDDLALRLYRETGCPVNSIYPLSKIIWLREHCPDLHSKAACFVSIKDYVIKKITGEWISDYSMASGTGMFDIVNHCWSPEALELAGLRETQLPRLVSSDAEFTFRNSRLREEWGLPEHIRVFPGGGDGPLANIGSGAARPGEINIDLGTSGAARVIVDQPSFDEDGRLWCYHAAPGYWAYGGIISNAGNSWAWLSSNIAAFRNAEAAENSMITMGHFAEEIAPGSDGLFFLPYIRKARAPYWDDRLQGSLFGLCVHHDIRHFARVLLEAIAYDLTEILEIASQKAELADRIILTGGLVKSPIVPQLIADVSGKRVETPCHTEGSLAGAAIIGLKALGILKDYAFHNTGKSGNKIYLPDFENYSLYQDLRRDYARRVKLVRELDNL